MYPRKRNLLKAKKMRNRHILKVGLVPYTGSTSPRELIGSTLLASFTNPILSDVALPPIPKLDFIYDGYPSINAKECYQISDDLYEDSMVISESAAEKIL